MLIKSVTLGQYMKTQNLLFIITLLAVSACAHNPSRQEQAANEMSSLTPSFYKAESQRAMKAFDSTGMVVAAMKDGEIIYLDAFGSAEEGSERAVTTDMLFPIASLSKAFTTAALAILVDRGQLDWDAPIRNYIPEFAMYDPWVSENFTLRDAITHRSGLPLGAGDLLFWPDAEPSVDDIIAALPHLEPSAGFRAEYAYDNLLYIVAGEVVARLSGKSWSEFVSQEIFEPIGLKDCAADITRIRFDQIVVAGHERAAGAKTGTPVDKRMTFASTIAAAGGVFCTAGDVMTWAKFWLDGGVTAKGERLVSEEQVKELWTGVTPKSVGGVLKESKMVNHSLYALGWNVSDFKGTRMITHSGGAPGVITNFILLPDRNIGIFASANDYRPAPHAITYQLADKLTGGQTGEQSFDFIVSLGNRFSKSLEKAQTALSEVNSLATSSQSSLPLSAYVGTYRDAWYGDVEISMSDNKLFIDMSRSEVLKGSLKNYEGDQFVAVWLNRTLKADAFVTFTIEEGHVSGLKMKAVSAITDFSYDFHHLNLIKVKKGED
jgi:CubicO group peptidase (beta-lactamase class C family)